MLCLIDPGKAGEYRRKQKGFTVFTLFTVHAVRAISRYSRFSHFAHLPPSITAYGQTLRVATLCPYKGKTTLPAIFRIFPDGVLLLPLSFRL